MDNIIKIPQTDPPMDPTERFEAGPYQCIDGHWMCLLCQQNHAAVRISPLNEQVPEKPEHMDLCPPCFDNLCLMTTLESRGRRA